LAEAFAAVDLGEVLEVGAQWVVLAEEESAVSRVASDPEGSAVGLEAKDWEAVRLVVAGCSGPADLVVNSIAALRADSAAVHSVERIAASGNWAED
jgi:hypothetical protein